MDKNKEIEKRTHKLVQNIQFTACSVFTVNDAKKMIQEGVMLDKNFSIYKEVHNTPYRTPLAIAAEKGRLDLVKLFIKEGADINCVDGDGRKPIIRAAEQGHLASVEALIDADPNFDKKAAQKLFYAMDVEDNFNPELVKMLIKAGANINDRYSEGDSFLMYCTRYNKSNRFGDLLIKEGAKLNLRNKEGDTALIIAVKQKNSYMALQLIKNKCHLNIKNNKGETALQLMKNAGYTSLLKAIDPEKSSWSIFGKEAVAHTLVNEKTSQTLTDVFNFETKKHYTMIKTGNVAAMTQPEDFDSLPKKIMQKAKKHFKRLGGNAL